MPVLLAAVKSDETNTVRIAAAQSLGVILERANPGVREKVEAGRKLAAPVLLEALQAKDTALRLTAAVALVKMEQDARPVTPVLLALLKEMDPKARLTAAGALIRLGTEKQAVVFALVGFLDRGKEEEQDALSLLWSLGPDAKEAMPAIAALLRSRDPLTRGLAAGALLKIDPVHESAAKVVKESLPALIEQLSATKDEERLLFVVDTLARLGRDALPAESMLRELTGNLSFPVSDAARKALRKLRGDP